MDFLWNPVIWQKLADVSAEHTVSIFNVQEQAKQEAITALVACFFFYLFKDRDSTLIRNVVKLLSSDKVSHHRK
jgi:hypothetical protein